MSFHKTNPLRKTIWSYIIVRIKKKNITTFRLFETYISTSLGTLWQTISLKKTNSLI